MGKPKKPVVMDGIRRFNSVADAARWLISNGHREGVVSEMAPNISACCHGRAYWAYGHTWVFEEDADGA